MSKQVSNFDFNKKVKMALLMIAVLNLVTAFMFYLAYNSSNEKWFLIGSLVNVGASIAISILALVFIKVR